MLQILVRRLVQHLFAFIVLVCVVARLDVAHPLLWHSQVDTVA